MVKVSVLGRCRARAEATHHTQTRQSNPEVSSNHGHQTTLVERRAQVAGLSERPVNLARAGRRARPSGDHVSVRSCASTRCRWWTSRNRTRHRCLCEGNGPSGAVLVAGGVDHSALRPAAPSPLHLIARRKASRRATAPHWTARSPRVSKPCSRPSSFLRAYRRAVPATRIGRNSGFSRQLGW